jgi:mannan endo-1,6-alpha-mannosidase
MYEGCEKSTKPCNVDQRSFKAYLTRCLAATVELAPFTHDLVMKQIRTSAEAAIKTCTAGNTGTQCGLKWTTGVNDGSLGVGEQMAVLEAVQSNLVDMAPGWVSSAKGTGTSEGNVNQGSEHVDNEDSISDKKVTTGGRVGAGLLTVLICVAVVSGTAGMIM